MKLSRRNPVLRRLPRLSTAWDSAEERLGPWLDTGRRGRGDGGVSANHGQSRLILEGFPLGREASIALVADVVAGSPLTQRAEALRRCGELGLRANIGARDAVGAVLERAIRPQLADGFADDPLAALERLNAEIAHPNHPAFTLVRYG